MSTSRGALSAAPSDYIDGGPVALPGEAIVVRDPSDGATVVWRSGESVAHVDRAVAAARRALPSWSACTVEERAAVLRRYAECTTRHVDRIADRITLEMGKIRAESLLEAKLLAEKVAITLDEISMSRVRGYDVKVNATRSGLCRFKPHGVMAVLGPYNFPAHLPNGHFVPALLLGNTVVFKPSDKTPGVAQLLAECMHEAGMPAGAFNVVQGGANVARALVAHDGLDGILFTGSWPVGRAILEANLDRPGRIVALELGGSNPAVVMPSAHLRQAVIECARAAFATTGQRCTCTRRVIVDRRIADRFLLEFCRVASTLLIGPGFSTDPVFMGPIVNEGALNGVLGEQTMLSKIGAKVLVAATRMDRPGHFVTPSVVEVSGFEAATDRETFGPLVRVAVVDGLDEAIHQANATSFGLAASIFTNERSEYDRFFSECRAGCINWNNGTAGASSKLPFGGLGHSGNHRPAAAFSVDYCAYPVASMVETGDAAPVPDGMRIDR
ncbi:MAG: aldehyde dehydrogenase family protein [Phycisphaerae bacterium]|jgi:succinylglutamic semialdehyde dehydrogenase|nr:aldehyde dehydrogenase family protein [Phycisphaerae bacterium]